MKWKIMKSKAKWDTMFLCDKTLKRKHPRVDTTTTGKVNPLYEKDLHTKSYQHYDIHFKLSNPKQPSG